MEAFQCLADARMFFLLNAFTSTELLDGEMGFLKTLAPRLRATLWFGLLLLLLLWVRWPFLSNVLVGEEGMHAAFVLAKSSMAPISADGVPRLMLGALDGQPFLGATQHPIGPYVLLRGMSAFWPVDLTEPLGAGGVALRSIQARLPFLLLYALGVAGLLARVSRMLAMRVSWIAALVAGVVLYGLSTPLAVGSSIQPQIDGSVGVFLIGMASWLLTWRAATTPACLAAGTAGVLVGFGKQEWVMALMAAVIATLVLGGFRWPRAWRVSLACVVGLVVGSCLTYQLSPSDYFASFDLMDRFLAKSSGVNRFDLLSSWSNYLVPLLFILLVMTAVGLRRWSLLLQQNPGSLIVGCTSWAIALGYAAAGWVGDGFPRYYSPALVAALYALVSFAEVQSLQRVNRLPLWIAFGALGCGLFINIGVIGPGLSNRVSITSMPGLPTKPLVRRFTELAQMKSAPNSPVYVDHSSLWIYAPHLSFVHFDPSVEGTFRNNFPEASGRMQAPR